MRSFCLLMPPSKRFFWPVFIDRLAPISPPVTSWSGTSFPSPVPVGMLFRSLCSGQIVLPYSGCTSDVNPRCMDLLASVISPLSSRFYAIRGIIVVITVHTAKICQHQNHFLLPRHSRYVTQQADWDPGTHAQSRQQDSEIKRT